MFKTLHVVTQTTDTRALDQDDVDMYLEGLSVEDNGR
jgi:hypothetical protein